MNGASASPVRTSRADAVESGQETEQGIRVTGIPNGTSKTAVRKCAGQVTQYAKVLVRCLGGNQQANHHCDGEIIYRIKIQWLMQFQGGSDRLLDAVQTPVRQRCLLYTSPSPRDKRQSRMPSSA